jgi:hypothetical protein
MRRARKWEKKVEPPDAERLRAGEKRAKKSAKPIDFTVCT